MTNQYDPESQTTQLFNPYNEKQPTISYVTTLQSSQHSQELEQHKLFGNNNIVHIFQIVFQLIALAISLCLFAFEFSEYVDYIAFIVLFMYMAFWGYSPLFIIIYTIEMIVRGRKYQAKLQVTRGQAHKQEQVGFICHIIKCVIHSIVGVTVFLCTIIAAPNWWNEDVLPQNRVLLAIGLIISACMIIAAILEGILIKRARQHNKELNIPTTQN